PFDQNRQHPQQPSSFGRQQSSFGQSFDQVQSNFGQQPEFSQQSGFDQGMQPANTTNPPIPGEEDIDLGFGNNSSLKEMVKGSAPPSGSETTKTTTVSAPVKDKAAPEKPETEQKPKDDTG